MKTSAILTLRDILRSATLKRTHALLRAVSGTSRFKILMVLRHEPAGLTPTEIAKALNVSLSRISHQLRILRDHDLVTVTAGSREVTYRLRSKQLIDRLVG